MFFLPMGTVEIESAKITLTCNAGRKSPQKVGRVARNVSAEMARTQKYGRIRISWKE